MKIARPPFHLSLCLPLWAARVYSKLGAQQRRNVSGIASTLYSSPACGTPWPHTHRHTHMCASNFFATARGGRLRGYCWGTSPNHLQYLGPAVRAGHRNRLQHPLSYASKYPPTPYSPHSPLKQRTVPAAAAAVSPAAVGFRSCRCYFGKVNFLSVKREIDMAASCFIS